MSVYCPRCNAEYLEGVTACTDCLVSLVDGRPPLPTDHLAIIARYIAQACRAATRYIAGLPHRIRTAPLEVKILNTTVWFFLLTALTLTVLARDRDGHINSLCADALATISLPWSLVGFFYAWQIYHDPGSALMFATYCIAFATLNGYLVGRALVTLDR